MNRFYPLLAMAGVLVLPSLALADDGVTLGARVVVHAGSALRVPDALSLEQAVWRSTLMPATVHGIADRGVREGILFDLMAGWHAAARQATG